MLACLIALLSVFAKKFTPLSIMASERTFIAVKPDGVQRGLTGEIIKRFEAKGFKMAGMKFLQASEEHLKTHYSDLSDKPFFAGLVKYMASGPLVAMCWEGTGVVRTARNMMGETKPADSKPGTIRGDFCIEVGRNIIHGSDSVESANKEIALWFKPEELVSWKQASHDWIFETINLLDDPKTWKKGLEELNSYLADRSYMQGYTNSKADFHIYSQVKKIGLNRITPYCHVGRWARHIKSICDEIGIDHKPTKVHNYKSGFANLQGTSSQKTFNKKSNSKNSCLNHSKPMTPMNHQKQTTTSTSYSDNPNHEEPMLKRNIYAVLLQVIPKDEETDMKQLEDVVRGSTMEGHKWGNSQLIHLAYGKKKLSILCTVEDDKVSIEDVIQSLNKFESYIKSVDIAAFNKL